LAFVRGFFIPGDGRSNAPFLFMLEKKHKRWALSALAAALIAFIVAKGDRITAAIGSFTAAMGALGWSELSMIVGITCTILTFVITNTVNFVFRKKEFELKREAQLMQLTGEDET
ncbi:HP1 family phage holin, partial [Bradyrhizobium canariense]|uniref:HP1 family phage holin n=2 Tax=Pseudomonadota TaxID=1224 RepID=UPI000A23CE9E